MTSADLWNIAIAISIAATIVTTGGAYLAAKKEGQELQSDLGALKGKFDRHLSPEQIDDLRDSFSKMCSGGKIEVIWNVDEKIADRLATQLRDAFGKAGMTVQPRPITDGLVDTTSVGIDLRQPKQKERPELEQLIGANNDVPAANCVRNIRQKLNVAGINATFNKEVFAAGEFIELRVGAMPWQ